VSSTALPCVALLFVSSAAFAAEPEAPVAGELEIELDGGVVEEEDSSATSQVASFAVTKLKDSPAVVTVVSSQEIKESGARDLVDVLQLVPGMFLGVDTQGVVGPGFRGLWGYEGKILLMVDGKEMNELLYSTMQLGNEFPVELIERVEVVRGPGSVIYGGNAELAVINIVTRGVQGGTDLLVSGSYGQFTSGPNFGNSYARRGGVLSGRYVFESVPGLSAFVSGSLGQGQRSSGTYVDLEGTSVSLAGNSALDPAVVQAGVGYRDIQASFLFHRYGTTSSSGFGTATTAPLTANFESYHGELIGKFHPTERIEIIPRLNVTFQRPWTDQNKGSESYYDKTARRLRARLIGRWAPIDELQITLGGDAMFDNAQLNGPAGVGLQTSFAGANTIDYRTFGGFVELFSENPIVNVAAGARYDNNSAVGGALVPRAVIFRSFGPVNLKGLFSLAFRWPGIENLNLGTSTKAECKPLCAERTTVFEFEGSVDLTKRARISANVFNIGIDAPIAFTTDPATGAEGYLNLGRQGTTGAEVAFRIRGKWGYVNVNYSLYVPTLAVDVPNYQAPGRTDMFLAAPNHRAMVTASIKPVKWLSLAPTVLVYGPKVSLGPLDDMGNATATSIPTQVLANFAVRIDDVPVKGLNVSLGVYNLFGTNFAFVQPYTGGHAPLPALGREVMLRVGYLFEPTYE
jgi:outer membrane receptor protein involved in Fe transport